MLCRFHCLSSSGDHGLGKEIEPRFPVAGKADVVEEFVIILAVHFEIETEVEHRLPQHLLLAQEQRDEQAAKTTIAVQKRMDSLELHVSQCRLEQCRGGVRLVVEEEFQRAHALRHRIGRRRNKGRISRPGAAYPVLAAPKFARCLIVATAFCQQHPMDFPEQSQRQRQPFFQQAQTMVEGSDIVADLLHIIQRHAGLLIQFEQQQV